MIEKIKASFSNYKLEKKEISGNYKPSSVLIPLYECDGETFIIFTKRSQKLKHHKGQISFPGGKFETSDIDLKTTALRETYEEIGIKQEDVTIIGQMDSMITITNFEVTPYIGHFKYPYEFKVNSDEIDVLIKTPLKHFFDESISRIEKKMIFGEEIDVHFYDYNEYTIWGATGKMLHDFLKIIR